MYVMGKFRIQVNYSIHRKGVYLSFMSPKWNLAKECRLSQLRAIPKMMEKRERFQNIKRKFHIKSNDLDQTYKIYVSLLLK